MIIMKLMKMKCNNENNMKNENEMKINDNNEMKYEIMKWNDNVK